MAVKSLVVGGLASSQLGSLNFRTRHPAFALSWENQQKRAAPKWVFLGGVSGLSIGRAMRLLEDENPWKPAKIMVQLVDYGQMGDDVSHGLHKDLSSLPKPLSISDIVAASEDGAKVRISYKDHTVRMLHSKPTLIVKQFLAMILKLLLRLLSYGWLTKLSFQ